MKRFKKFLYVIIFSLLLTSAPGSGCTVAEAHSGRTDSASGHHDYKNASGLGSYHYHCGGHSAHLHKNGVCPYSSAKKTKIKLNKKSARLKAGGTLKLKISGSSKKVVWTSSRKSVAAVNSKGKVTAKQGGTATITAKVGSKKYKCRIKVTAPTLNKKSVSLSVGESTALKLKTKLAVKWSSSDKMIVSVNKKGKITAKSPGKAVVTAKSGKKKYQCKVTVTK